MRIVLTIHHPLEPDSGAAGTTLDLARAYEARGHEVDVLSHDDLPRRLPNRGREASFPLLVAAKLRRLCSRGRIDVIDASTADAWLWGRLRRGFDRRPVLVARSHGLEHAAHAQRLDDAAAGRLELSWRYPLYWGGLHLWEVGTSLRVSDLSLFLNGADREYAVSELGVEPAAAHVVHNAIADHFLGRTLEPARAGDGLRIAHVGSYIQRKGIAYTSAALRAALERHPDLSVSFLGTGCSEAAVHRDFPPALRDRIVVHDRYRRQELPKLLDGHHVKLFPSLSEGFGKTVLEAMACGLAPIAADVPGPTEFIRDGENGILVEPRDAAALEQAIERLHADRALLGRLRTAAHATAQSYSWDRLAGERLRLYEGCLELRHASTPTSSRSPSRSSRGGDRSHPERAPRAAAGPEDRSPART
jgi:glycosyltransferase involved in cell wall biosynthesis